MKASRIVLISALTTVFGTWIVSRTKTRVPGFSR